MALQELQVGVAGHQASKGVISTGCHRVYQLLGGLGERHGGSSGGGPAPSLPSHIAMVKIPLPRPLRNSRDTQNWVSFYHMEVSVSSQCVAFYPFPNLLSVLDYGLHLS